MEKSTLASTQNDKLSTTAQGVVPLANLRDLNGQCSPESQYSK
jgi:hypothetical protein